MYHLVIISVNEPLLAGLYTQGHTEGSKDKHAQKMRTPEAHTPEESTLDSHNNLKLCKEYRFYGHTTHALNELFSALFSEGVSVRKIYYARGPGRFSALKATHIYLHTLSQTKGYELLSTQSFAFNGNNPIHAFANKYFVLHNGEIVLESNHKATEFMLPQILYPQEFGRENTPLYVLPAV
ncbi:tRNA threonylcarbamoyladenosine biosynthesis protein TsaB [uncultured Helicobacter sp.]|uniref:tRNA threonylcarbamoyladenosine biosynthesis protein TsaB n=1 Tax=uncultured Helicobacter sp. TaxID=175537 RepID=UPI00374FD13B